MEIIEADESLLYNIIKYAISEFSENQSAFPPKLKTSFRDDLD